MKDIDKTISKLSYKEFVYFMKKYEKDTKKQTLKEKHTNPYKYVRVFKKDNK